VQLTFAASRWRFTTMYASVADGGSMRDAFEVMAWEVEEAEG